MKRGSVYVAVVLLFLGMMIAVQVRSTRVVEQNTSASRVQELSDRLRNVQDERDFLRSEAADLRNKLNKSAAQGDVSPAVRGELQKARMQAGLEPVRGKGIRVTMNDNPKELQPGENPNLYILHEEDLLKVVNEIKAGGAEAVSVNDQRLTATSEIRCAGNTILVNTKKIAPPIVMLATGDPDTLSAGLLIKGGIIDQLKLWGLVAEVQKQDDLVIPGYKGPLTFSFTQPVK